MKLKPEERKAFATDLLKVIERFDEDLTTACIKHGMSPEAVRDSLTLEELRAALQHELARP